MVIHEINAINSPKASLVPFFVSTAARMEIPIHVNPPDINKNDMRLSIIVNLFLILLNNWATCGQIHRIRDAFSPSTQQGLVV